MIVIRGVRASVDRTSRVGHMILLKTYLRTGPNLEELLGDFALLIYPLTISAYQQGACIRSIANPVRRSGIILDSRLGQHLRNSPTVFHVQKLLKVSSSFATLGIQRLIYEGRPVNSPHMFRSTKFLSISCLMPFQTCAIAACDLHRLGVNPLDI